MRSTILGALQTGAIIGITVAMGLAYASCAASPRAASQRAFQYVPDCANTMDPTLCGVQHDDELDDGVWDFGAGAGALCDTDTHCEELDAWQAQ